MITRKYIIVENAGYDGEQDVKSFPSLTEAMEHIYFVYDDDERKNLHVDIRQDWTDASGQPRQEYIY